MQHKYINLTSWDKPWDPEIDWLNSYVNLSTYYSWELYGLITAYRNTKYSKYYSNTEWGCRLMFPIDPDLADAYYIKYFADTNNTMYMCNPRIQMNPDLRRKMAETHPSRYYIIRCSVYQLGLLKHFYTKNYWGTVFDERFPEFCTYLVAAVLITIVGIFGEYSFLKSWKNNWRFHRPKHHYLYFKYIQETS